MINQLPMFKGYFVDARCKEFRKINTKYGFNLIKDRVDFDEPKGDRLLTQYIKTLDIHSAEFDLIARAII